MHDESGIAWDLEVQEDGTRSLRVGCQPGRRYTIEQSADLDEWSPVRSWAGLATGQVVATDIFLGPPPPGAPAGQGQPTSPPGGLPRTALLMVQPVDDGSTVLNWRIGNACASIREPAGSGSWGPPTMVTLHSMEFDGWMVMLQARDLVWRASSPSLPATDPVLPPDDAAFHAVLLANRAAIATAINTIHETQQAASAEARLRGFPPGPSAQGRFFRVREESGIDSDGDGLTDEQELALGLNIFCNDTDGDGMDDRFEVVSGLDAHDNTNDWLDPDSDGLANIEEARLGTDARKADTDGDGIIDGEDAVPKARAIDWRRTPDCSYVWVPIGMAPLHPDAVVRGEITSGPEILFGADSLVDPEERTAAVAWSPGGVRHLVGGWPADFVEGGWAMGISDDPEGPPVVSWPPGVSEAVPVATGGMAAKSGHELFLRVFDTRGGGSWSGLVGPGGRVVAGENWNQDEVWTLTTGEGGSAWSRETRGWTSIGPDGTLCSLSAASNADVLQRPDGSIVASPLRLGRYWVAPTGRPAATESNSGDPWLVLGEDGQWRPHVLGGGFGWRKMNRRGEVLQAAVRPGTDSQPQRLWRNGKWTEANDLLPPDLEAAGWSLTIGDINDDGVMLCGLRPAGADPDATFAHCGILLPVELYSDLNDDGEVNSTDSGLVGKPYASGASEEEKDKGTEFMFANDNLSNGAWDKEDTTTPGKPADADDDDAEPIFVGIGSLPDETRVWLDHPASAGLKYYRDRKCTEEIPLSSGQPHVVGGSVEWPDDNIVFVRAESVSFPDAANSQVEGDLKLMVKVGGAANGIEGTKMKLTIIKELGAKKYFHGARDYILENNTPLFRHCKTYNTSRQVLITAMRERNTIMRALDTYHHTPRLYGIDQVTARYPSATVIINGNMTFDRQDIGGGLELTRRCHGRLVSGATFNANTSSDNADENVPPPNYFGIPDPLRGSELAGPNGKHIAMTADGNFKFSIDRVPLDPMPKEALGGLSTNYAIQNSDQFAGVVKIGNDGRMLFTITCELTTSGVTQQVAADAKRSGVEALPGGAAHELMLFKFDGGTSLALSHAKPDGTLTTPIKGSKHTGRLLNDYCVHTYLMFQTEKPRSND